MAHSSGPWRRSAHSIASSNERSEIFEIHLRSRNREPAAFDIGALARAARGFSGAEIEQAIVSGLYQAFEERRPLEQAHIEQALAETRPLSTTMREDIAALREWAATRARLASTPDPDHI